jgi:hypothetical protein
MEFVDGVNLRQAMKAGRFTPAQALAIVPKICEALQFAHNEGVLHRDIKPENILLDTKGRVKIADFGIAKLAGGGEALSAKPGPVSAGPVHLTETGRVLGTPQYMAPEQLANPQDVDPRADIYSLGVVFYEMLTGELPQGKFAPPSEKSQTDPRVDEIVLRALEKERERRQQSAVEMKTQVETLGSAPLPARRRRWQVGGWKLAALLVAAALLPLAVLFALAYRNAGTGNAANSPWRLKSLPTTQVIDAGIGTPMSPWPWQELEKRAQSGRLTSAEANSLLDRLSAWMRRDYPHGYGQPLFSIRQLFEELSRHNLVSEDRVLQFLDAYSGIPVCEVDRVRETNRTVHLSCKWRDVFQEKLFGLNLFNEIRSVAIDGQPVSMRENYRTRWDAQDFEAELQLPSLAPGEHTVTCEIESALVPENMMAGLPSDVRSKDWPPARRRWTRTAKTTLVVFAAGDEIVRLTHDPKLNPVVHGLTARQVIVRARGGKARVTVVLDTDAPMPVPISFDVSVRVAGQTNRCGRIYKTPRISGRIYDALHGSRQSGGELGADFEPLDPQVTEADVVLTPDPVQVESFPDVKQIWGDEIIVRVPLLRLDQ